MAECHPVGFQWVMEAKARGATVIHVDPRFTRTSALADMHVPLRAGTDIAFLGGIINYVLSNEKYFREYVARLHQRRRRSSPRTSPDTEDLDGVFSGLDPRSAPTTSHTWQYEGAGGPGRVRRAGPASTSDRARDGPRRSARPRGESHGSGGADVAAGSPSGTRRCSIPAACSRSLKRHFARYTPEMVEQICGVPAGYLPAGVRAADRQLRPGAHQRVRLRVGWTQHTVGVQYIRTAAILQLLLGNIGRPGGGIMALRGHA